jgi:hypothetical protein
MEEGCEIGGPVPGDAHPPVPVPGERGIRVVARPLLEVRVIGPLDDDEVDVDTRDDELGDRVSRQLDDGLVPELGRRLRSDDGRELPAEIRLSRLGVKAGSPEQPADVAGDGGRRDQAELPEDAECEAGPAGGLRADPFSSSGPFPTWAQRLCDPPRVAAGYWPRNAREGSGPASGAVPTIDP